MTHDRVVILDFGSQYTQLIARRLRELQVYSEILPPRTSVASLRVRRPRGIVLSGGPDSVYAKGAPTCDPALFGLGVPVLGICYGMQLMGHLLGGEVKGAGSREFGHAEFERKDGSRLLDGVSSPTNVWMSHGDSILAPSARVHGHRGHPQHAHRGHRGRAPRPLRDPVPPRGEPHRRGQEGPGQLPRRLRVPPRLERGLLHRGVGGRGSGPRSATGA